MSANHRRNRLVEAAQALGIDNDPAEQSAHARLWLAGAVLGTAEAITINEATASATGHGDQASDPMPLVEHAASEAAGLTRQGYWPVWLARRLEAHLQALTPATAESGVAGELVDVLHAVLSAAVYAAHGDADTRAACLQEAQDRMKDAQAALDALPAE